MSDLRDLADTLQNAKRARIQATTLALRYRGFPRLLLLKVRALLAWAERIARDELDRRTVDDR